MDVTFQWKLHGSICEKAIQTMFSWRLWISPTVRSQPTIVEKNKYISHRDHAVQWLLKKPTRRGCVQNIIKLKDVKGYLSQFNVVDPHHGWPLFIGTLGHRQEKF
ncbi:hypothetical protein CEXT_94011 [Caerostris extrusa]|uniref:Uncharacterized protein n=1 Tax=Caerostris extrusa TaxID=172846 RepID=A0AAV4Q643_CAEEX|nr:hypothetical protein CEXT_94011 [Caerostris extrusa]